MIIDRLITRSLIGEIKLQRMTFRVLDRLYLFIYRRLPGLALGSNVVFLGKPSIYITNGAAISIGQRTIIMSRNWKAHVNYFAAVKLIADRPNAEIRIGRRVNIASTCIHAYKYIEIGDDCLIGPNANVFDCHGHPTHLNKYQNRRINPEETFPVVIGKRVWLGMNSVVLPGTQIGEGSIISANSVVRGKIPPFSYCVGNPVKIIKDFVKH